MKKVVEIGYTSTAKPEIFSIQYLRGAAALSVVLGHASLLPLDSGPGGIPFDVAGCGVDLFFVISGFIMLYTTASRSLTAGEFYIRRLIRIFPLYFAATSLAFLIAKVAPSATRTFSANISDYIRSVLFIPYYSTTVHGIDPNIPLMRPELGQGWSLNYEVFFYFLFGLSLFLPRRYRLTSIVALFLLLATVGIVFRPASAIFSTYTDSLLLEFVLGVLLAFFLLNPRFKQATRAGSLLLFACAITFISIRVFSHVPMPRVLAFGVPATALMAVAIRMERASKIAKIPFLLLLGDASYSIYLLHGFVLAILRRVWERYFDIQAIGVQVMFAVVCGILASAVGIAVFRYGERPVTKALNRLSARAGLIRRDVRSKEAERHVNPGQRVGIVEA